MNETKLTMAGAIKSNGCTIHRSLDKWIVSRDRSADDVLGGFLGEVDTLAEAEALATQTRTDDAVKVSEARASLDILDAEAAERRAERQGEEASEARRMGTHVTGFDNDEGYECTEFVLPPE